MTINVTNAAAVTSAAEGALILSRETERSKNYPLADDALVVAFATRDFFPASATTIP